MKTLRIPAKLCVVFLGLGTRGCTGDDTTELAEASLLDRTISQEASSEPGLDAAGLDGPALEGAPSEANSLCPPPADDGATCPMSIPAGAVCETTCATRLPCSGEWSVTPCEVYCWPPGTAPDGSVSWCYQPDGAASGFLLVEVPDCGMVPVHYPGHGCS